MFGFLKKRKMRKKLLEATELIGKDLILRGYDSESATHAALHAVNLVFGDDTAEIPQPLVLAALAIFEFKKNIVRILKEEDPPPSEVEQFETLIKILDEMFPIFFTNAYAQADTTEKVTLDLIKDSQNKNQSS